MSLKVPRRALYLFTCEGCGFKRSSVKYRRASSKQCRNCRRRAVPENQPSLFPDPIITQEDVRIAEGYVGRLNNAIDNKHKVIFHPAAAGSIDFIQVPPNATS